VDRDTPEQVLLLWLDELPLWLREALVKHYNFMAGVNTAEFVFSEEEAWSHLKVHLTEPEFPLRRVARLLTVRALLTFLLELSEPNSLLEASPAENIDSLRAFEAAQLLRTRNDWDKLCRDDLSDVILHEWLLLLQQ